MNLSKTINGAGPAGCGCLRVVMWLVDARVVFSAVVRGAHAVCDGRVFWSSPRPISTSPLNPLPGLHVWPINPVVYLGALPRFHGWETSS